jgi:ABC-type multidrug transport system fused ATPase/permease subunit
MILAECEDVGNFVGSSVSVPVLEGGFLITVFVYLAILQPWMAIAGFAVLTPQIIFVPLIQSAINRRVSKRISLLRQVGFDVISASIAPGAPPKREKLDVIFSLNVGIFRLKFSMNFLMNLTYSLGIAAILGLGGWFLVRGETEIATVVTFLSAIGKIVDPWNDVVDWARDLMVSVTKYGLIVQGAARLDDARQW